MMARAGTCVFVRGKQAMHGGCQGGEECIFLKGQDRDAWKTTYQIFCSLLGRYLTPWLLNYQSSVSVYAFPLEFP